MIQIDSNNGRLSLSIAARCSFRKPGRNGFRSIVGWRFALTVLSADPHFKAYPRHAWHCESGRRSLGNLNLAVKQILACGKHLETLAKIVRSVYVQPEIPVRQVGIGCAVKLPTA